MKYNYTVDEKMLIRPVSGYLIIYKLDRRRHRIVYLFFFTGSKEHATQLNVRGVYNHLFSDEPWMNKIAISI